MIQRPTAVGLTLCRLVLVEEQTRNITLASTFYQVEVDEFPTVLSPFFAYVVLTDGLGDVTLDLAVTRCETLEPIYTRSVRMTFRNPLGQARIYWQIRSCSFPLPGRYEFSIQADGEMITQSVLNVKQQGDSND